MRPPLALVTSRALRPQDGSPATTPSTLWPPTPSPSMRTACDPARWMTPAPEEAPAGSLAAAAPCVYTPFGHGPLCHQALCLQPVPVPQALLVAAPADPYSRQQALDGPGAAPPAPAHEDADARSLRVPSHSLGSALHGSGECKPCAWYYKAQGCSMRGQCDFCHLCLPDEVKNRKKAKVAALRRRP